MYTVEPQTVVITACLSLLMCKGTAMIWMTNSFYGPSLIQGCNVLSPNTDAMAHKVTTV